jgi:hypothetical protein
VPIAYLLEIPASAKSKWERRIAANAAMLA